MFHSITPEDAPDALRKKRGAVLNNGAVSCILCLAALLLLGGILLFSSFRGLHSPDESFYLTVPYRVYLGDALLIDEWQESQFSSFLQYLPLALFIRVTGSADGIVLFFRILFVICQTAVSIFIFFRMKRFGVLSALCSAALFLVYVPEYVESLDYYTMSLMALASVAVILFPADRVSLPMGAGAGVLFACAVVAQPMLAVLYILYTAGVFTAAVIKKKKNISQYLTFRVWGSISVGVLLTAVVFLVFLLSRASLKDYIDNIGNLFLGYNHILPFVSDQKGNVLRYDIIVGALIRLHPVGFYLSVGLTSALFVDFRRLSHRTVWCLLLGIFYAYYVVSVLVTLRDRVDLSLFTPYILFVFSLHCYLLTRQKNRRFLLIWLAGLVYTLCLGAISRALNYVGVIGCVISNIAFAPISCNLIRELRAEAVDRADRAAGIKKTTAVIMTAVCVACGAGILFCNAGVLAVSDHLSYDFLTWRDHGAQVTVTQGPLKGIAVSEEEKDANDRILSDLSLLKELAPGKLYVAGMLPYVYLASDEAPGTCSAWNTEKDDLLKMYYEMNPAHIPVAVYVPFIDVYRNGSLDPGVLYGFVYRYKENPFFKEYTMQKGDVGYFLIAPDAEPSGFTPETKRSP